MRFAILVTSFLSLASMSFGADTTSAPIFGLDDVPHFAVEGQTFFISTECSPHSLGVTLQVIPGVIDVKGTVDYVRTDAYSLDLSHKAITWRHTTYAGGFEPVSSIRIVEAASAPEEFHQLLLELTGLVEKVQRGNVCFPSRSELTEVVDYLHNLAGA